MILNRYETFGAQREKDRVALVELETKAKTPEDVCEHASRLLATLEGTEQMREIRPAVMALVREHWVRQA